MLFCLPISQNFKQRNVRKKWLYECVRMYLDNIKNFASVLKNSCVIKDWEKYHHNPRPSPELNKLKKKTFIHINGGKWFIYLYPSPPRLVPNQLLKCGRYRDREHGNVRSSVQFQGGMNTNESHTPCGDPQGVKYCVWMIPRFVITIILVLGQGG